MNNLWKKETNRTGTTYVDLFASVSQSEWNIREVIKLTEYFKSYHSVKDNRKAAEFRMQGNDEFRKKHWSEAMQLYNQSLCFAEVGTEEVAMAYANRSACFFHMQKYQKVLADIELAKSVNLSDGLLPKLEQREQESLKMMAKVESPIKRDLQLSYPANRNYPCLAEVVDIKRNDEFGRHLVATQDIPVGKLVLLEEDFMAMRMGNDLVCETCFRENANFIACANCPDVVFCSVKCMNRNLTHNWECGSVPRSTQHNELMDAVKFQIRVLFLALQTFGSVERLMEFVDTALKESPETIPTSLGDLQSQYHFFFKLKGTVPPSEHFSEFYAIYKVVHSLPKINALFNTKEKQRFLMHLFLHHLLVTYINSIGSEVRCAVANILSMLNHSCHRNVYTFYTGRHHYSVSIRPIKKGDQLFTCYLQNEMDSWKERQEKLKARWNFVCKCSRCISTTETREAAPIKSDPRFRFVALNCEDDEKLSIVWENCVQLLSKYGEDPWSDEFEALVDVYTTIIAKNM